MLFFMYDNFFKIKDRYRVLLQCLICLKFFVNKYIYISIKIHSEILYNINIKNYKIYIR